MICHIHKLSLISRKTKFGIRHACPEDGCSVVCWDGSTSTPADLETRQARMKAHTAFDEIWKSGRIKRTKLYKLLAKHLGKKSKDTHIGHFDKETAIKVVKFAKNFWRKEREAKKCEKT